MKIPLNIFPQLIELILRAGAIKATKIFDDKTKVTACRKLFHKKISNTGSIEILITIGKPNFKERKFIKVYKKAGEPFPIKKIQVKYPTQSKRK